MLASGLPVGSWQMLLLGAAVTLVITLLLRLLLLIQLAARQDIGKDATDDVDVDGVACEVLLLHLCEVPQLVPPWRPKGAQTVTRHTLAEKGLVAEHAPSCDEGVQTAVPDESHHRAAVGVSTPTGGLVQVDDGMLAILSTELL
eukprot:16429336-Heterocapsa_arctica.AAC.1